MIYPEIKYDFPVGGFNPFNRESTDKYFINASGLSNLSNNLGVFNLKTFEKHIPIGYRTIVILERITFYSNGQYIPNFDHSKQLKITDKFYLISNKLIKTHIQEWNRAIDSYSVLKTNSDASLKSYIWNDYEEAKNTSKKISARDNSTILICKILNHISWH